MVLRKIMGLFVCALVIGSAALATAGIPDPIQTVATMPNAGNDDLVLFVLPNGFGNGFDSAQVRFDGTSVDATIEMIVKDAFGAIVPNFPLEDMWLESADGGMVPCTGGTYADQDTDDAGYTIWADAPYAGGNSQAACVVYVNGQALDGAPFALGFNSADINGDGVVNLADVGLFTGIYFGTYDFSADFDCDNTMNLADVQLLASGLGGSCP